jgi:hypothetical protein
MSYLFPFIQLIAAIVGVWNYKKLSLPREKYFILFLWFTFLVELTKLLLKDVFEIESSLGHSIYSIISFLFYFYWYYDILESRFSRIITLLFTTAFLTMSTLAFLLPEEFGGKGYAFVTGAISLLVLTFFHFYQLLRSDEVLIVKYKLSFWVSTALLLFYMGILPLILLAEYLDVKGSSYTIILICLNLILYGCYIIGFVWTKKMYDRF